MNNSIIFIITKGTCIGLKIAVEMFICQFVYLIMMNWGEIVIADSLVTWKSNILISFHIFKYCNKNEDV